MEPWFSIFPTESVQADFDRIWTDSWTRDSKPWFSIFLTESAQTDFDRIWTDSWPLTWDSKPWFSIFLTESVQPGEPNRFVDGTALR